MPDPINVLQGTKIISLLDQACAQRTVLHLRIAEDPHVYDTYIDDIEETGGIIKVMTLEQGDVDRRIEPGMKVAVLLRVDGLPYRFSTKVAPDSRGIHNHKLKLPEMIEAIQRRMSVRVTPPTPKSIQARAAWAESDTSLLVEVLDLSLGGALLRLPVDSGDIEPETPATILLEFPDKAAMEFSAKFCRILSERNNAHQPAVGIRFIDVSPAQENELGRILMLWQRQQKRNA